jgi:DNA repair exonuclease SbcCD ATPase subunit
MKTRILYLLPLLALMVVTAACNKEVPKLKQQIALQDSIIKASQTEQESLLKAYDQTFEELSIIASGGIPQKNPSESVEEYAAFLEEREFMINNFKSDLGNLRQQLDDVTQQFNDAKNQIRALRSQNKELVDKNEELTRILDQKFREIDALSSQYEAAEARIAELQVENQGLRIQVDQLQTEIQELRKEYDIAMQDLKTYYTAYYTIGTRKSLDRADVIRVRGIGKPSKTASLNYDGLREKMNAMDKRDKTEFIIQNASAKNITLLPLRDETTFELEETEDGAVVVRIVNTEVFWQDSDYLVIIY